jgi:outer membrane protein assembly factor BamB
LNGAIYGVSQKGVLFGLDQAGKERWRVDLESPPAGLTAAGDGTLYVSTVDGKLHAVGQDGRLRWSTPVSGARLTAPSATSDGHIYLGGDDGVLRAVGSNGAVIGSIGLGSPIKIAPLAGSDGALYVALSGRHGALLAFGSQELRARYNVP